MLYGLMKIFRLLMNVIKLVFLLRLNVNSSSLRFFNIQHFRNTPDSKVEEYLKIFTFLPFNEIQQLIESHRVIIKLFN